MVEAHVARLLSVPDEPFFDLGADLVRALDIERFDGQRLDLDLGVRLRALIADRLRDTASWKRERARSDFAVETWIGPAIAAMFFNDFGLRRGASCYLLPPGITHVDPFLPELSRLIHDGPVPFLSDLTMNLLEVAPRPEHLDFLLTSTATWIERQPDNAALWVDGGLGVRVVRWIEAALAIDATLPLALHPSRSRVEGILARLVRVGVAEAHRLEARLAKTA